MRTAVHNRRSNTRRKGLGRFVVVALLALFAGCKTTTPVDNDSVISRAIARTGFAPEHPPPPAAALEDGLTEDEAVLLALWHNALFQQQLADLGVARGDLVQAGLLPNPEFLYTFPMPDKAFRYAFEMPLEALWLRPIRVAAATGEVNRVREQLTQNAFNLIRDVRQAYADVLLARGQLTVAEEAVRIRGEISKLAEARLKAGDISPQEATTARVDTLQAQQDLKRVGYDVSLAEERLRNLLALGDCRTPLKLDAGELPATGELDAEMLTCQAVGSRPDALAAIQSTAAAAERLRLSKLSWVRFLGIGDATAGRRTGHELGPGFRVTVPIFDRNQGNIARAAAELERAERQQVTIRNQIILDVHQACYLYDQAQGELSILTDKVLPEAKTAIDRAERAYREGETSYAVVLEATRQILVSLGRREQLQANLRRARAELERSVGLRLETVLPPSRLHPPMLLPPIVKDESP